MEKTVVFQKLTPLLQHLLLRFYFLSVLLWEFTEIISVKIGGGYFHDQKKTPFLKKSKKQNIYSHLKKKYVKSVYCEMCQ